jgi:hypothetical protein
MVRRRFHPPFQEWKSVAESEMPWGPFGHMVMMTSAPFTVSSLNPAGEQ